MSKIVLDSGELESIKGEMQTLQTKISEISSGGYVSGNLFSESSGTATGSLNTALSSLVNSGKEMEQIVTATGKYLTEVIDGFVLEDQQAGESFNLNEQSVVEKASPDGFVRT